MLQVLTTPMPDSGQMTAETASEDPTQQGCLLCLNPTYDSSLRYDDGDATMSRFRKDLTFDLTRMVPQACLRTIPRCEDGDGGTTSVRCAKHSRASASKVAE